MRGHRIKTLKSLLNDCEGFQEKDSSRKDANCINIPSFYCHFSGDLIC